MRVPVTLPSWILEDGALPVPSVGDVVSYRVTFSQARTHDVPSLCVQERATAQTIKRASDGYFDILLSFPTFTAEMSSKEAIDGDVSLTGRFVVDYERAIRPEGRLSGTVEEIKLLIEETYIPNDPKAKQEGPSAQELHDIGTRGVQFAWPQPLPGSVWRRPTGIVLSIDLPAR